MSGVSGAEVRVGGTKLDDSVGQRLVEARIQENLRLPDACLLRFSDPNLATIDQFPIQIGSDIEVLLSGTGPDLPDERLQGQGRLARARVRNGDDARLPGLRRLPPAAPDEDRRDLPEHDRRRHRAQGRPARRDRRGHDRQRRPGLRLRPAEQRDRLGVPLAAGAPDRLRGARDRPQAQLPQGRPPVGHAGHQPQVGRQPDQLQAARHRRPAGRRGDRASAERAAVGAVRIDDEPARSPTSAIGISRATAAAALGGGTMALPTGRCTPSRRPTPSRPAYASHMAAGYVEAEGVAKGNPPLKAGIEGEGRRHRHELRRHLHRLVQHPPLPGSQGYQTHLRHLGRSPRSLVDLMTPAQARRGATPSWSGIVTQNNDPDDTGRVRVKYPALGDEIEGWWARIVAPTRRLTRPADAAPGRRRGRGRVRARRRPPALRARLALERQRHAGQRPRIQDGSFALQSDQKIQMHAKDVITIKSDKDLSLETTGKIDQKPQQDMTLDGAQSVTIKGGTTISIEARHSSRSRAEAPRSR